jgi:hypothetical protein
MIFEEIGLNVYVLGVAFVGLMIGFIMLNWVNKTVGLGYAFKLYKMKKKNNINKILLKIWLANGKPQYQIKNVANLIEYTYKENNKEKNGLVKYDYYAMYKDFSGIPILECDPNDIVPRNPFINTSLTISGEILKKNIIDSSKEDLKGEDLKKFAKIALPIIIAIGVLLIFYSSNQSEALAECTRMALSQKSAIITSLN